jgi:hypothetical protein
VFDQPVKLLTSQFERIKLVEQAKLYDQIEMSISINSNVIGS